MTALARLLCRLRGHGWFLADDDARPACWRCGEAWT